MPQSVLLMRFTQVKEEPQRGGGHKRKRIGNTLDHTRKPKTPKYQKHQKHQKTITPYLKH